MSKPDWKEMAGTSSRNSALRTEQVVQLVAAGKRLLDSLPPHWHDDATVEFRDLVATAERTLKP